jgi:hypothetical protein
MSGVFAKLQWKNVDRILVVDAPDEFAPVLDEVAGVATVETAPDPEACYDFALVFVRTCADVAAQAGSIAARMNPDAMLWFAYPKKSSKKFKSDISRDEGWAPLASWAEPVRRVGSTRIVRASASPVHQTMAAASGWP